MSVQADTVLVTGGAGFVGSNLVDRLVRTGHRVRIYDNLSRAGVRDNLRWLLGEHGDRLEVVRASITERGPLRRAVRGVCAVFHLAAQVAVTTSLDDPLGDFETNARGTLELLEATRARARPPALIFTSSNKVYGCLDDLDLVEEPRRWSPADPSLASGIAEERPLDLRSPYACSKGASDQYVLDYARTFGLPALVLRMSCIYGPHQMGSEDQGWIAHFLLRAIRGEPITVYGDGKQVRDVLFVDDLVEALLGAWAAIDSLAGRAFNVGGGPERTLSLLELLDLIAELRGEPPAVLFARARPGDQRYYVSDCGRLRRATGWNPSVTIREGIGALHAWLSDRWSLDRTSWFAEERVT